MKMLKERAKKLGLLLCKEDCQDCMMCCEKNGVLYCEEMPEDVSIDKAIELGHECPELDEDRLCEEMIEAEYDAYRHNRIEIIEISEDIDITISITKVDEQPDEDTFWSYPLEEIPYIMEQIKDGDRANGYEFHLYDGRLYETEETETW